MAWPRMFDSAGGVARVERRHRGVFRVATFAEDHRTLLHGPGFDDLRFLAAFDRQLLVSALADLVGDDTQQTHTDNGGTVAHFLAPESGHRQQQRSGAVLEFLIDALDLG